MNQAEKAYLEAIERNYYFPRSGILWSDIDSFVRFLEEYKMHRVMPARAQREKVLAELISSIRPYLSKLEDLDLLCVDLSQTTVGGKRLRDLIVEIYRSINTATRPRGVMENATLVGKVMHVLQPRLFVIWDDKIRQARGFKRSFDEYWRYLEMAQKGLREVLDDYRRISNDPRARSSSIESSLYEQGCKPITKLYDEACWAMVQGWIHFC
jgi:hypothetical protein